MRWVQKEVEIEISSVRGSFVKRKRRKRGRVEGDGRAETDQAPLCLAELPVVAGKECLTQEIPGAERRAAVKYKSPTGPGSCLIN